MRSFNWNNITASIDGDFQQLPAGGYVAKIIDMVDNEKKEYVELVWDIAEGEFAGRYSDKWGQEHPYAHHLFLSYKDAALPMLKGRLEAIEASNRGFDPFAAWDAGRLDMFRGRLLGINLQEEEYESNDGKVRTRMNVCQVLPVDDVLQGKVRVREKKTLDGVAKPSKGSTSAAPVPSSGSYAPVNEDDIPF